MTINSRKRRGTESSRVSMIRSPGKIATEWLQSFIQGLAGYMYVYLLEDDRACSARILESESCRSPHHGIVFISKPRAHNTERLYRRKGYIYSRRTDHPYLAVDDITIIRRSHNLYV